MTSTATTILHPTADDQKRAAAEAALAHVADGLAVGLGSGSTAEHFVRALGARVREGLKVRTVATSERTAALAREHGIAVHDLNDLRNLDVCVDGADEADDTLNLIKGGGGAHLREKMVAVASAKRVIIADASKHVGVLGRFPLPVEVVRFGWKATAERIAALALPQGCAQNLVRLRGGEAHPFITDEGNFILDCDYGRIPDAPALAAALSATPGVVEHGLFIGLCDVLILGHATHVETIERSHRP